jgi:GNAT superfamily N-acetyltransferase
VIGYRICAVNGSCHSDTLKVLHSVIFKRSAPAPEPDKGHWWLAYSGEVPVGFAWLTSTEHKHEGYLARAGVLEGHRGHGLQLRLIRVRERKARALGMTRLVTDTYNNPASSNSLIRAGYRLFRPSVKWSFAHGLYWEKSI